MAFSQMFEQYEKLNWANKDISRKLFEANQRAQQLAIHLGFKDIFEANAVVSRDPTAFNRFYIEQHALHFGRLEKELEDQQEINTGLQKAHQDVLETLQQVSEDNQSLKDELERLEQRMASSSSSLTQNTYACLYSHKRLKQITSLILYRRPFCEMSTISNHSTPSINGISQFVNTPANVLSLQLELNDLQARYDSLLEAKEKAAARYKNDYKKWRDFKREIHGKLARGDAREFKSLRLSTKLKRRHILGLNSGEEEDTRSNRTFPISPLSYVLHAPSSTICG